MAKSAFDNSEVIDRVFLCGDCCIDSPDGFLCPVSRKKINLYAPVPCEKLMKDLEAE
jgi:hypothetical protein